MEQMENIGSKVPLPKKKSAFRDFFEALVIALVIALPIKYFIASPFIVVGTSMSPTFENNDYLIVDKITYRLHEPNRGDVVIFRPPFSEKTYFIKRIVGLPGETIKMNDEKITVINKNRPEGFVLSEKYVSSFRDGVTSVTLRKNEYFVMGDNRAVSSDSRVWGPLSFDRISGRAIVRVFPLSHLGILPGAIEK